MCYSEITITLVIGAFLRHLLRRFVAPHDYTDSKPPGCVPCGDKISRRKRRAPEFRLSRPLRPTLGLDWEISGVVKTLAKNLLVIFLYRKIQDEVSRRKVRITFGIVFREEGKRAACRETASTMERDLQDIKEEIRARTDIVEIIGTYTRLKRSGKNWTGLCPFHADKNPSFSVNIERGLYKCFSCGEGGDLFKFVGKKENLDFIETVEFLAKRAGIAFERKGVDREKASEREQAFALNELTARFFQERLTKSQDAQTYLAGRAILKSTQEQFQVGFAPPDWEALSFYLQKSKQDMAFALKIGLVKERKEGNSGYYDTFRNRLMFPIFDVNGRVIAFGGRAMGDDKAKYLNSEASLIFDKSRTLYGLNFARKKLSGDIPAVFVEGYVDVITAHQAGFSQCVATLGTSMTEEHARLLVRYNPKVVICYDSDSAGIKATLRGAAVWESIGIEGAEVRVARLPAGEDPDSILKRGETALFQKALDEAIPRVAFQLELTLKAHDLRTPNGRAEALAEAIPVLATVPHLTVRDRYAQQVAYLHTSFSYDPNRATQQILADAAAYAKQNHARDRNYPLSEDANRGPLENQPPPPAHRPPSREQWGKSEPWTPPGNAPDGGYNGNRSVNSNGNGGGNYGNGNYSNGGYGNGGGWRKRKPDGPISDTTPVPLNAPPVSGAEKAERQLLRALFQPEFRAFLLHSVRPELLVTANGRRLFDVVARIPASSDGGIDPQSVLRRVESDEEAQDGAESRSSGQADGNTTAKLSAFIRETLEDFHSIASNEPLNEAVIRDCIRRLERHRDEQTRRELLRRAETPLTEDQQIAEREYQRRTREMKGSQP